jgi:DNA-directed RNA polymerase specialized sigma24 family protein
MEWLRARSSRQEFERFVTDRSGSLLRTAYLMAGNLAEAEDLVQETLLRVARHWPKVRAMEYPAAYARRVLVNVALDGAEGGGGRTRGRRGRVPPAQANSRPLTAATPRIRQTSAPSVTCTAWTPSRNCSARWAR